MKVLLDTNVLVAAFVAHGACHELLEHCFHHHDIVITEELLEEFREALRVLRLSRPEVRQAAQIVRAMVRFVQPATLEAPVCREPDDDRVLAAAARGDVSCIVTGDEDLLVLKEFRGIRILSPGEFWRFEER